MLSHAGESAIGRRFVGRITSRVLPAGKSIDPIYAYVPPSFRWSLRLKSNALLRKNICFLELHELVKQISPPKKFQEFKNISFVGFHQILNHCINLLFCLRTFATPCRNSKLFLDVVYLMKKYFLQNL